MGITIDGVSLILQRVKCRESPLSNGLLFSEIVAQLISLALRFLEIITKGVLLLLRRVQFDAQVLILNPQLAMVAAAADRPVPRSCANECFARTITDESTAGSGSQHQAQKQKQYQQKLADATESVDLTRRVLHIKS